MEDFLRSWGYLGVFLGIIATGAGFPMPEELPVVIGGGLAGSGTATWWLMLPVCIVGVVIGDGILYGIGRLWGPRLLQYSWVQNHLLPPQRLESIERNFHTHGIKILLFARLTPGIRAPIFFTAGLTRLPLPRFLMADGLYAIPGVSLLFFVGYWFTESMVNLIMRDVEHIKSIVMMVAVVGVGGYFLFLFLRRPMVTGDPAEVPGIVEQVTYTFEQMTTKIIHPKQGTDGKEQLTDIKEPGPEARDGVKEPDVGKKGQPAEEKNPE